jgi:dihydrolipoamide dehydrogenase
LLKKNKITRYTGQARLVGPGKVAVATQPENVELAAKHIIIATGSVASSLPGVPFDGVRITTSTEALSYPDSAETFRGDWRWIYRIGAWFGLEPARVASHSA